MAKHRKPENPAGARQEAQERLKRLAMEAGLTEGEPRRVIPFRAEAQQEAGGIGQFGHTGPPNAPGLRGALPEGIPHGIWEPPSYGSPQAAAPGARPGFPQGAPGAAPGQPMPGAGSTALMPQGGTGAVSLPEEPPRIGKAEVAAARETLQKYRQGKQNLESRVVSDELWWELRHWEDVGRGKQGASAAALNAAFDVSATGQAHARTGGAGANAAPKPSSAFLFNAILNKHADAMDNYPEVMVLPRERSDEASAKTLSEILPVVMEYNGFEKTYSAQWWEKLKHGTSVYGVFWNSEKENGLGDIDITGIDLLRIFWEPGVEDIQKSRNLFIVELADREELEAKYPEYRGRLDAGTADVRQYLYDDTVDTSEKTMVVDWYYKLRRDGRTVLHYAKFCGDCLLYASENDPAYRERGFYDHGLYPVVFDVLFPEKGTPAGFGYVAICKNPQIYIDSTPSAPTCWRTPWQPPGSGTSSAPPPASTNRSS